MTDTPSPCPDTLRIQANAADAVLPLAVFGRDFSRKVLDALDGDGITGDLSPLLRHMATAANTWAGNAHRATEELARTKRALADVLDTAEILARLVVELGGTPELVPTATAPAALRLVANSNAAGAA